MIVSFKHKGLEKLYRNGSTSGVQTNHVKRLRLILARLECATQAQDMNIPGFGLHFLKGNLKNHWSVKVSGNWRVTFKIENGHAEIVDYQDYH